MTDAASTGEVPLAGRTVEADAHRPVGAGRGAAIVSHGFARSGATLLEAMDRRLPRTPPRRASPRPIALPATCRRALAHTRA